MIVGGARRRVAPDCRGSPEIPNDAPLFDRFVERFCGDDFVVVPAADAVFGDEASVTADGERFGSCVVNYTVAVVDPEPEAVAAQGDDAVLYEAFVAERVVEDEDAPRSLADAAYRGRKVVFRRKSRTADAVGVELFPKIRQGADDLGAGSDLLLQGRYGRRRHRLFTVHCLAILRFV